jgi:hypothetical protein
MAEEDSDGDCDTLGVMVGERVALALRVVEAV